MLRKIIIIDSLGNFLKVFLLGKDRLTNVFLKSEKSTPLTEVNVFLNKTVLMKSLRVKLLS